VRTLHWHMRLILFWVLSGITLQLYAQGPLKQYMITSKRTSDCLSYLSLPLFEEQHKLEVLNKLIINELIKYHYGPDNPGLVPAFFYKETKYAEDAPLDRNIVAECTFSGRGVYSFIAVPMNACQTEEYSNYPTIAFTLDSARGVPLKVKDLLKPEMQDTFEGFVLWVARRYNIKNLPTGYIISGNPPQVRGSNPMISSAGEITHERGLQPQFYFSGSMLYVYNYAKHEHYPYTSVEVGLPIRSLSYFLLPEWQQFFAGY
jgi:hypothetical protein